ncbi:hypothetical protein D3C72_835220 [compost metagenome]
MAGHIEPEGQILTGAVAQNRTAVLGLEHEGGDDRAFGANLDHFKGAPAVPAALGCRQALIERCFAGDQDVGQEPVGLAPGRHDLFGRRIPQDVGDGAQQGVSDMGIVLGQDLQADVLLGDALDCCGQGAEVIDVVGIGQDGAGQSARLRAGVAVVRLIEQVANVGVLEHPRIHLVDDVEAVGFEGGNGGFDKRNRALAEGLGHQRSPGLMI